eukprot:3468085-Rhodomonas_salina.1
MSGTDVGYDATRPLRDIRYGHRQCCFTPTMRCPVLTSAILLHARYAISGTNIGYAATSLPVATFLSLLLLWAP